MTMVQFVMLVMNLVGNSKSGISVVLIGVIADEME
jgi:hypothetical protein